MPKLKLLFYKNLLDQCFARFFNDFSNDFAEQDGIYVYSGKTSIFRLKKVFKDYLRDELQHCIEPSSFADASYYFIVGACCPKDNILLDIKDSSFPRKLDQLINSSQYAIKYYVREKGIRLDLVQFNDIVEQIFLDLFKDQKKVLKLVGPKYTSLFFIQHARLDCLTMYKLVKWLYGKSCIENLHKTFCNSKQVICSINEQIDKHIHDKSALNKLSEFSRIAKEVKQYIDSCIATASKNKRICV